MTERLAFNVGAERQEVRHRRGRLWRGADHPSDRPPQTPDAAPRRAAASRRPDWAWRGLLGFTTVMFLRPQDHLPALEVLRLAEICAIIGLGAMIFSRLSRGQFAVPLTPEAWGLFAFGAAMLSGIPFSFWPGGSFADFTEIYVKVVLIVLLMIHSLDRVERLERFLTLIVLFSGYLAARAVIDYMRGVNLVEGSRVGGSVGGIFGNPNDLALNMVAFLPFALAGVLKAGAPLARGIAGMAALLMIATIVFTRSRGGSLGLVVMFVILVVSNIRVRPAIAGVAVVAMLVSMPFAPASFWDRMSSIFVAERDETGSRQARIDLMKEGWRVFTENPGMGIGLGQFVNYNPAGRKEAWRATHNAPLQVAAELGLLGLLPFFYLIARAWQAARTARHALAPPARPRVRPGSVRLRDPTILADPARNTILIVATALIPALVGWFICAQFASVALNWTFYYILGIAVAARELAVRIVPAHGGHVAQVA